MWWRWAGPLDRCVGGALHPGERSRCAAWAMGTEKRLPGAVLRRLGTADSSVRALAVRLVRRFDMLLWKRHYQWNRNKPKDLLVRPF